MLYCLVSSYTDNKVGAVAFFLIVLFILMIISMFLIQKKIYSVVWEDYEYLSRIKNKEKQQ